MIEICNQNKPMPEHEVLLYELENVESAKKLLRLLDQVHRISIPKFHQELMEAVDNATERIVIGIQQRSVFATLRLKSVQEDIEEKAKDKAHIAALNAADDDA